MTESSHASDNAAGSTQTTISQVAGRVLDQLSVSSWLPSGVIVSIAVGTFELHDNGGSLLAALADVGDSTFPQLVIFVAAVTLTTVVAQAFEFEAIRFLEGYWHGPIAARLWRLGMRNQRRRQRWMRRASQRLKEGVGESVRSPLNARKKGFGDYFIDRFLCKCEARSNPRFDALLADTDWAEVGDPQLVMRYFAASRQISRWFPISDLELLPTTLGNVMKRYEELALEAEGGGHDVEGIVHRSYARWPEHLRHEYDSFRGRLNVYCTLSLVLLTAGLAEFALLAVDGVRNPFLYPAALLCASWIAYRASVASAFGVGKALLDGVSSLEHGNPSVPSQLRLAI